MGKGSGADSGRVERGQEPTPDDWTKLPAEFTYLKGAVVRYGQLMALGQPLCRRLKSSEREELREIALKIGWHNHDLPLQSWVVEHSIAGDTHEVELVEGLLVLLEHLGFDVSDYGPKQEPQWTLHLWDTLHYRALQAQVEALREILPDVQAFEVAIKALDRVPPEDRGEIAFWFLHPFQTSRTLDWIESHPPMFMADEPEVFSPWSYWGYLTAVSEFSWSRAEFWLDRGRPLSLIALDALANMDGTSESPIVQEANPKLLDPVSLDLAAPILTDYATRDGVPRVEDTVALIQTRWLSIIDRA